MTTSVENQDFYRKVLGLSPSEAAGKDAVVPDLVPVDSDEADRILALLDDED